MSVLLIWAYHLLLVIFFPCVYRFLLLINLTNVFGSRIYAEHLLRKSVLTLPFLFSIAEGNGCHRLLCIFIYLDIFLKKPFSHSSVIVWI